MEAACGRGSTSSGSASASRWSGWRSSAAVRTLVRSHAGAVRLKVVCSARLRHRQRRRPGRPPRNPAGHACDASLLNTTSASAGGAPPVPAARSPTSTPSRSLPPLLPRHASPGHSQITRIRDAVGPRNSRSFCSGNLEHAACCARWSSSRAGHAGPEDPLERPPLSSAAGADPPVLVLHDDIGSPSAPPFTTPSPVITVFAPSHPATMARRVPLILSVGRRLVYSSARAARRHAAPGAVTRSAGFGV